MKPVLALRNFTLRTVNGRLLAKDLNFELSPGDLITIEGENGAGKTTLIKSILGLHRKYQGELTRTVADVQVAWLPQLGNLQFFLPLTLQDVIELEIPSEQTAIEKLKLLSVSSLELPWNTASGGERQKALLTRTLLKKPKLLILDEPFNHLDRAARGRLVDLIHEARAGGCAVLIVAHEGLSELKPTNRLKLSIDEAIHA